METNPKIRCDVCKREFRKVLQYKTFLYCKKCFNRQQKENWNNKLKEFDKRKTRGKTKRYSLNYKKIKNEINRKAKKRI